MELTKEHREAIMQRALPLLLKRKAKLLLEETNEATAALKLVKAEARTARDAVEDDASPENRALFTLAHDKIQAAVNLVQAAQDQQSKLASMEGQVKVIWDNYDLLGQANLPAWCDTEEIAEAEKDIAEQEAAIAKAKAEIAEKKANLP